MHGLQEGDEEKGSSRQQGAPLLQPQKGDSASSLRAAYTKDAWEGSDQSPASSREQQPAVHYSVQEPEAHGDQSALLHPAETHENQENEDAGGHRQDLAEQASNHQSQELLADALMQAQQSQDELSDSDQPDSSDQVSISAQHLPQQLQQQQQHVKPLPLRIQQAYSLDEEASAVSLVSADGVLSIKQTVLFSLHPSRLWAFLGLGIPGGLASSVQSAAYEVTTAMAGVLGGLLFCRLPSVSVSLLLLLAFVYLLVQCLWFTSDACSSPSEGARSFTFVMFSSGCHVTKPDTIFTGTIQIDAHTTMLSVSDILFTFLGYGFGVGCTIRVGQLLGSQRPAQAKLAGAHVVKVTASHRLYRAGE